MAHGVVSLKSVYARYNGRDWVLKDVTLELEEGIHVVLGGSGSGKTTLLRVIAGLIGHVYNGEVRGIVSVNGRAVLVPQLFDAFILMPTPRQELMYSLSTHVSGEHELRSETLRVAKEFGLTYLLDRPVHKLSSGERQRLAIASALSLNPDILMLDEPLAHLDKEMVDKTLESLRSRGGRALIVAEHRAKTLLLNPSTLSILEGGQLKCTGTVNDCIDLLPLYHRVVAGVETYSEAPGCLV
ncbi:MAG: energy-coupling factor ABC transporter ATP-binding protein [Desulfurococcales archaeon]|nr:energy-coupling factor ABC transporter ATP-binding protein [Desulfurococcales archaeon]